MVDLICSIAFVSFVAGLILGIKLHEWAVRPLTEKSKKPPSC